MYGTLSRTDSGQSLRFHRLLALTAIAGSLLFGIIFIRVLPSAHELLWDRILVLIISLALYAFSYMPGVNAKWYVKFVYSLLYLHTIQAMVSLVMNDFEVFHIMSFFIITQVCGFSFRTEKHTFWYYALTAALCIIGIARAATLQHFEQALYACLVLVLCVISYTVARLKCRFVKEMKMKEKLMRDMVSKTENSIFLVDIYGNILDMNDRALEMFGYSRDEMVDKDFKILRKHDLNEAELDEGLKALDAEKFWVQRTMLLRKNLEPFHARISISLLKHGRSRMMIYRVQDTTELKKYEEQIVEEKEKAQTAAKSKAQFLAVMSHEIRTPLNGVIATASLLQREDLSYEQMEYVETIKRSGDSLLMLINDILEFSKMESGKMQLDAHNSSVRDMVGDVTDLLKPHAESKGVKLQVETDQDVPDQLWMDGHRLKQVLLNLMGNAIKFTAKGSVKVKCENVGINKREVMLKFTVKDSGIGIPEAKLPELFQTFTQVDSSTSRKYGGTGLGLVISKQLVELMQGTISVKSREGLGTEFSFTLKCELAHEGEGKDALAMDELIEKDISRLKVLVAEDNDINKQVFHFMLQNLKVETDFAENGAEVLEKCAANNYDIIFMDMQMPVMDGLEATHQLRARQGYQPIIVAISANSYAEDRRLCTEAGMNDFLSKPFDMSHLKAILYKWNTPPMHSLKDAA
ncbi:MAG: ATP-binding protein [Flavobacteriales bacterium]